MKFNRTRAQRRADAERAVNWRELRCTEHTYKKNSKYGKKGEYMNARVAYSKRGCRCQNCRDADHAYEAERYANNIEKNRLHNRSWYATHREERMARTVQARERHALDLEESNLAMYRHQVALHRKRKELEDLYGVKLHVDHVMPLAGGGDGHWTNLAIVLAQDNLHKHDTHPEELKLNIVPLAGMFRYSPSNPHQNQDLRMRFPNWETEEFGF